MVQRVGAAQSLRGLRSGSTKNFPFFFLDSFLFLCLI